MYAAIDVKIQQCWPVNMNLLYLMLGLKPYSIQTIVYICGSS